MCVCACVCADSGQLEKQLEDVSSARRDLEDSSKHIRTLEKQMKTISQERDDLHKVEPVLCRDTVCLHVSVLNFLFISVDTVSTELAVNMTYDLHF